MDGGFRTYLSTGKAHPCTATTVEKFWNQNMETRIAVRGSKIIFIDPETYLSNC